MAADMNIGILALENCLGSSITGPMDILTVATLEHQRTQESGTENLFQPDIISIDGQPVTSFSGTPVPPAYSIKNCPDLDLIFIPVIYGNLTPLLSDSGLIDWLADQNRQGVILCAVCAGVFLAAQTGLLNNRRATTHWHLAADFASRYPDVILKKEKMLIDEGDIITAGGVTAYMDMSLYLVKRFGSADLSSSLSRILLIDPVRQSQTPYSVFDFNTSHQDENILKIQALMGEDPAQPMPIERLADMAGLGLRTFARRFKKATGDTPLEYLHHLRISKAKNLLETTDDPVTEITWATGYEDVSSFRRLFKKNTGLSPTAYRKKFKPL